ncbi:MAG TPA: Crp/Fnr family transcriptional regulator [Flavitalea sp.]|nr:Crp/Fnr family transcriptional regulator [Flavitalea sp.]
MPSQPLINFLTSSNLFSLSTAGQIANQFTGEKLNKHDFLLQEGKLANKYFFLENGFMRSFAYDLEGYDITTNFYSANQVVFEVSSFFERTPSRENIQCLTDCEGWYITYEQLNHLFHALPEFREFGRSILVKGFAALKNRMLSMITETAEQRYDRLIQSNPEIFQHAPLKHIASYLGITDTSLSRIRKEFQKNR